MSEREQEVRRAREVLNGAGWVFDNFIDAEKRAWLATQAADVERREEHWRRIRVATEMAARLTAVVEDWDYDTKVAIKRDQPKDK